MILLLVLHCVLLLHVSKVWTAKCLLGHMTDVQNWVNIDGTLKGTQDSSVIDLSGSEDAVQLLNTLMTKFTSQSQESCITTLSLSSCNLWVVPQVFGLRNKEKFSLADSLQYLTLHGNNFYLSSEPHNWYDASFNATNAVEYSPPRPSGMLNGKQRWDDALRENHFKSLRELDLRSCCIRTLQNYTFENMPALEALYLSDNAIVHIEASAFHGLESLLHLDLSHNNFENTLGLADSIQIDSPHIFRPLKKLGSLDFSNTRLSQANVEILGNVPNSLQRLSICNVGIMALGSSFFSNTKLRYLDVSGNNQILIIDNQKFIEKVKSTLVILYADHTGLQTLNSFKDFSHLEVLKISNNAVASIPVHVVSTWKNLKVLDMLSNRIPSWFGPIFRLIPQLKFLSLIRNNLNMISEAMVHDLRDIHYIGLSDNYFVCSCTVREFMEASIKAEKTSKATGIVDSPKGGKENSHKALTFHTGFSDYQDLVENRKPTTSACQKGTCYRDDHNSSYLLFDYDNQAYRCYIVSEDVRREFIDVAPCDHNERNLPYENIIEDQTTLVIVMSCVSLAVFVIVGLALFRRWWCLKYFCITVKNSALLSMIGDDERSIGGDGAYHYDVFVSYCNEDRAWVLDQLLPHVEADCSVSVCLHERDFQVGLSILENIASCMDRSRSIMLVISHKFLLSQWCQFEMHLAQHRLLETRREDLILILLEDIPRRRRPHTLHYLMMTKTYIVWPHVKAGREAFWKRVKRSLTHNVNTLREQVSEA